MARFGRVVAVTIGLVGTGLVCGAFTGGTAFMLVTLLAGDGLSRYDFLIGAYFGAPLGALTAPVLSWLLLRRVPLGRMFLVCSIGTMIGGIAGWFAAGWSGDIMVTPLLAAFAGCLVAAFGLHLRVQRA